MAPSLKLLHISAHLGGGIGRVLSRVARHRHETSSTVHEIFLCLEEPRDMKFVELLKKCGAELIVCPSIYDAKQLISSSDLLQIEWWHHPLLPGFLNSIGSFDSRIVVWSHVSGLYFPSIPREFLTFPDLFLFSTPVSMNCPHLSSEIRKTNKKSIDTVHSSGGFEDFPIIQRSQPTLPLKCGYVGTYNFAKLHPQIIQYLETAKHINFTMDFYGDLTAAEDLTGQMAISNCYDKRIRLNGYVENPSAVLAELNVFIYLLNPNHYGSTENALLEAMASGVVPIVMNNPVERSIVTHNKTGFIVNNPHEFVSALDFCANNLDEILQMAQTCTKEIRERFSLQETEKKLRKHYLDLIRSPKRQYNFCELFGNNPSDWFFFALGEYADCFQADKQELMESRRKRLSCPIFYEKTKSSIHHFYHYYPESKQLERWVDLINADLAYTDGKSRVIDRD